MPITPEVAVASRRGYGFRIGVFAVLLGIVTMHSVPSLHGSSMGKHDAPVATTTVATHSAAAPQLVAAHTGGMMDHFLHLCLAVLGSVLLLAIGATGALWFVRRIGASDHAALVGYASGRSPPDWWTLSIHRLCVSRT